MTKDLLYIFAVLACLSLIAGCTEGANPAQCSDRVDNNYDGRFDCDDPGCAMYCDDDDDDDGCDPGDSTPCSCVGGEQGTAFCGPDSEWSDCECDTGDDDDAGDDDAGDDDAGDDDVGDDDDTPTYEGTIDMAHALLEASCTVTDEVTPESPEGAGYFDFFIELEGWASSSPPCWIELWDLTSPYCEGYDPSTGDPCDEGGVTRPGWDMNNVNSGWNASDGFWDEWELTLDYHGGGIWPPDHDASLFVCENAGNNFETWFCCCDHYDDSFCDCTQFPMGAW